MTIERTADISVPASRVYELLTDESRVTEWRSDLVSSERVGPPGPLDGAKYKETLNTPMGKQSATVRMSVREHESIGFEVLDGPLRPTGSLTLADLGGSSTRVTYRMDVKPMMGIPTPMDALANTFITAGMEKSLAKLKSLLEG